MHLLGIELESRGTITSSSNKLIKDFDGESYRGKGSRAFFLDIWTVTLTVIKEQRMPTRREKERKKDKEREKVRGGRKKRGEGDQKLYERKARWKKRKWWTSEKSGLWERGKWCRLLLLMRLFADCIKCFSSQRLSFRHLSFHVYCMFQQGCPFPICQIWGKITEASLLTAEYSSE